MKIIQLINDFLDKTLLYRKEGTYNYYLKVSKSIIKALEYNNLICVNDLDKDSQKNILIYFKKETTKKNSQINADIGFLYSVLNYSNLDHKLTPFTKLPDDTTPFRALDDHTLKELVNWLYSLDINESNNLSWKLTIFLMLESGMRMNEILNVKTSNIDLETNSILLEKTKSGVNRIVFFDVLSKDLIIKAMNKNKEYLIWNYNKQEKMKRAGLFYFFNIIDRDLKPYKKITSHRLRKTFATRLLRNGCPLTTIQKLLGHSDIRMTMKYLEIDRAMIENDYFVHYPYKDLTDKKQPN